MKRRTKLNLDEPLEPSLFDPPATSGVSIELYPAVESPGPRFAIAAKGGVNWFADRLRPTHAIGFVDPGESSPLRRWRFVPLILLRRSMVIEAYDDHEISETVVDRLLSFGSKIGRDHRVLIHCHHGRSRSAAAVVLLVALIYGAPQAYGLIAKWRNGTAYQPNQRMLAVGFDRLNMRSM